MRRSTVVALLVLAHVAACAGPSFKDHCDKLENCVGGNDKDKAACVATLETSQDLAGDIGCGSEFDDYATCVYGASSCRMVATGTACTTNADCDKIGGGTCSNKVCQRGSYSMDPNDKSCEAVQNAYQRCSK